MQGRAVRNRLLLCLGTLLGACVAEARVLSHTAVTDAYSVPAVQKRTNRYFLLIERDAGSPYMDLPIGRPVLHDSTGAEPPRPLSGIASSAVYSWAAYNEGPGGAQYILLATTYRLSPDVPEYSGSYLFSRDGGRSFIALIGATARFLSFWRFSNPAARGYEDVGGPIARGGLAGVRLGPPETPFVFLNWAPSGHELVAVSSEGGTRRIPLGIRSDYNALIVGSDAKGRSFLVVDEYGRTPVFKAGLDGTVEQVLPMAWGASFGEGFVSMLGDSYVVRTEREERTTMTSLMLVTPKGVTEVAKCRPNGVLFAVPTSSHDGAWIVERGWAVPTTLSLHTRRQGMSKQWSDETGREVVALHTGSSGGRLLVEARLPRAELWANRLLHDPVVALWTVGQPAPARYDELLVLGHPTRGFVNLDVDRVAEGGTFVFDGGEELLWGGGGTADRTDVPLPDPTDEKGVVRSALTRKLAFPMIVRGVDSKENPTRSDVVLSNPVDVVTELLLEYEPEGPFPSVNYRIALAPKEIRLIPDILWNVFRLAAGRGALFVTPDGLGRVDATSSVRITGPEGTFGTVVPALDVLASAHPRRPHTFSAAFPGFGFETSLVTAGVPRMRGGLVDVTLEPSTGGWSEPSLRFDLPAGGHARVGRIGSALAVDPSRPEALAVTPQAGEALATVVVEDTVTGDPTLFVPDADYTGTLSLVVPGLVHLDEADGSRIRSDLFIGNSSNRPVNLFMQATPWQKGGDLLFALGVEILPGETRRFEDVLLSLFGTTGIANLEIYHYGAGFVPSAGGLRVTTRRYALARGDRGGTYGTSIPPVGPARRAVGGEVLEILGVIRGSSARADLSIVGVSDWEEGTSASIEILDHRAQLLDRFDVTLGSNRGVVVPDLLRTRNLTDGTGPVLVRVIPKGRPLAAFVTLVYPGTDDLEHLEARVVPGDLRARGHYASRDSDQSQWIP